MKILEHWLDDMSVILIVVIGDQVGFGTVGLNTASFKSLVSLFKIFISTSE
jgi:hypothetical protein